MRGFPSDEQMRLHVANAQVLGFDHNRELTILAELSTSTQAAGEVLPVGLHTKVKGYRIKGKHSIVVPINTFYLSVTKFG